MTKIRWHLLPLGIGLVAFSAFVGSISGSLAWWAYSTRATVSYQGTSVTTSAQLQIGIKAKNFTDYKASELAKVGLKEDTSLADDENHYRYFFADAGSGMPSAAVNRYLALEGLYATNELTPVSTHGYSSGELSLYETLISGRANNNVSAATNKYVKIPIVFRIGKNTSSTNQEYIPNQNIWLTDVDVSASSANPNAKVYQGIRTYFDNGSQKFILNPSDRRDETDTTLTSDDFYTTVAGVLDLDRNGLYDYDDSGKEILYGNYSEIELETPNTFVQTDENPSLENINGVSGVTSSTPGSTFYSKHAYGKTCYADYSGLTLAKAYYKTLKSIAPTESGSSLSGGTPICVTSNDEKAIGEVSVTVWLEGWDHSVIDAEINHAFNLGLQFQINLVS